MPFLTSSLSHHFLDAVAFFFSAVAEAWSSLFADF